MGLFDEQMKRLRNAWSMPQAPAIARAPALQMPASSPLSASYAAPAAPNSGGFSADMMARINAINPGRPLQSPSPVLPQALKSSPLSQAQSSLLAEENTSTQAPQTTFITGPYGSGSSNYVPPGGQSRAVSPLAPTFQVPTSSPLSAAYNALWEQNPGSTPSPGITPGSDPYPAFGSVPAGQTVSNPNVALPTPSASGPSLAGANTNVPAGADRLASPSLTAARNSDFFSDGRGGPTPTLQSSGGLDRGGFENEARQRVAQDDYERRINTLAARNLYQNVAGGGLGGGQGRGGGSKRIYAAANPATETIDTRTAKAATSIRKDRNLLEQQSKGLAAVNSIESEKGALTASEIDQRIKELQDMRRSL